MTASGIKCHMRTLHGPGVLEVDLDPGFQLVNVNRLRQEVDTTGFQCLDDMLGLRKAGHEDHRDVLQ